jgi:sec-independent protein translocase protein TatA
MEFLIILVIIIILFGAKKIPGLAKGIGNGVKEFRKGLKGDDKEELKNTSNDEKKT